MRPRRRRCFRWTIRRNARRSCGTGLKGVDALIAKVEASSLTKAEKTNVLHELRVKRVQFNDALVQALGLRVAARMEPVSSNACSSA